MPIMALPYYQRSEGDWVADRLTAILQERIIQRVVIVDHPDRELTNRFPQPTLVPFVQVIEAGELSVCTQAGSDRQACPAGTALYFPAGTRVDERFAADTRVFRATWDEDLTFLGCQEGPYDRRRPSIRGLVLPGAAPSEEAELCRQLDARRGRRDADGARILLEHLLLLLRDRCRHPDADQVLRRARRWPQIEHMLRRTCTRSGFSRQQIARMAGIHPNHLSRLVRRETGRTFQEVVTDLRLDAAEAMLADPTLSVQAIAERCAFSSPSHFVRRFKQRHGQTPGAWRARSGNA